MSGAERAMAAETKAPAVVSSATAEAPNAAFPNTAVSSLATVQRHASGSQGAGPLDPEIGANIQRAVGGGRQLPNESRVELENYFGADLSPVRIHDDAEADELSQSVQAKAFTTGADVFFRSGEFKPSTSEGRHLLAHEVSHTLQRTPASEGTVVDPNDASEVEADELADGFVKQRADAGAAGPPDALPSDGDVQPTSTGAPLSVNRSPLTVRRHRGPHPANDGHTEAEHDENGQGPRFRALVLLGDPAMLVRDVNKVLNLVRTLRPDSDFQANGLNATLFQPVAAMLYFEDYIVFTDSQGRVRRVEEQPGTPIMIGTEGAFLREPASTRLWVLGHSGDRARAAMYWTTGGVPDENQPEGRSVVLVFDPGHYLGEENATRLRTTAQDNADIAAGRPPRWARDQASRVRRRRRRRQQREQQRPGGPGGSADGTGTGRSGTGPGGGGNADTGHGTGTSGTGTGQSTSSTANGRGGDGRPLRGPEQWRVRVNRQGRVRVQVKLDHARTRWIRMRQGESDAQFEARVERELERLQQSRDPSGEAGLGVHEGANSTGVEGTEGEGEVAEEVPEDQRRGPGGPGADGEGGGSAGFEDDQERLPGATNGANAAAYPSTISMAGVQRQDQSGRQTARRSRRAQVTLSRQQSADVATNTPETQPAPAPEPEPTTPPVPTTIGADVTAPTTVLGATNVFTMALDYSARSFGLLDGVANRMQPINFYWELIDVTGITPDQAARRNRNTRVGGGEAHGPGSGVGNDLARARQDIVDDQQRDLAMMSDQEWPWQARAAYLSVIGLSNSVRMIGSVISSMVSVITSPLNERSIGFDREGEFLVRCVATPRHTEEALADPDNHVLRASSVAVMPIRVQNLRKRANETLNAEQRNIAQLEAMLASATTDEERQLLQLRLAAARREQSAGGHASFTNELAGLRSQLALANRLKARGGAAPDISWPLEELQLALHLQTTGVPLDQLIRQVSSQLVALGGAGATTGSGEHERWVASHAGDFTNAGGYRPRIVLASRENGQVTPIRCMLGQRPGTDGGPTTWRLVNISGRSTRDYFDGQSSLPGVAGHQAAIRDVFRNFAETSGYGRGVFALRLPPALLRDYPGVSLDSHMVSAPGARGRALQRLQDAATVAEIAGLFVAGPAGIALGAVGAVAGLTSSIDSLARRQRSGQLLEVATLFDIVGIVGGVAGVGAVGTGLSRLRLDSIARNGGRLPSWVTRVERTERALRIHGRIDNVMQLFQIPHQLLTELEAAAGAASAGERQRDTLLALLRAGRSGGMLVVSVHGDMNADPISDSRARLELEASMALRENAAHAHADGSGPALPPAIDGAATDGSAPRPDSEPANPAPAAQPAAPRMPTDEQAVAHARHLAEQRLRETNQTLYQGDGDTTPRPATQADGHTTPRPAADAEGSRVPADRSSGRARDGGTPIQALLDLAMRAQQGASPTAAEAQQVLLDAADIREVRSQLGEITSLDDAAVTAMADQLQNARVGATDLAVQQALAEIGRRFPELAIEMQEFGRPGFASDRDITVRATPRDAAAFAQLSDAQRQAVERQMVQASAEMVPLLYQALERAGLPADRALDTNFYTDLHEGLIRTVDPAEATGIIADQQVVSMSEVILNTTPEQWARYREQQLAMIDGHRQSPPDMRSAQRERFLQQVIMAEMSVRRLLGGSLPGEFSDAGTRQQRQVAGLDAARERLIAALTREPPASPREQRRLMADVKLLEPDAYGTRGAVEHVVLGGQGLLRNATAEQVQADGFRSQADIDAGTGEPGPQRFDGTTGMMSEISAEAELADRRARAEAHVGPRRPGDRTASAFEINAPRLSAAEAVLGHLLAHLGSTYGSASTTAKNLGRIAALADELSVRSRSSGMRHLPAIVAAKGEPQAARATRDALQRWARDRSVAAWAQTNGLPMGSDAQQLRAFHRWAEAQGQSLVGQLRNRTSAASVAGSVEVGGGDASHLTPPDRDGPRPADTDAPTTDSPTTTRPAETDTPTRSADTSDADAPTTTRPPATDTPATTRPEGQSPGTPTHPDVPTETSPEQADAAAHEAGSKTSENSEGNDGVVVLDEDGLVDLDHPANAHLIDGMVGALPGEAAFDRSAAQAFFEGFVTANPGLESALVRNTATGEFLVVQGNADVTGFGTLLDAASDLVPEHRAGRGRWQETSTAQPPRQDYERGRPARPFRSTPKQD